jgi:hypothetical protein
VSTVCCKHAHHLSIKTCRHSWALQRTLISSDSLLSTIQGTKYLYAYNFLRALQIDSDHSCMHSHLQVADEGGQFVANTNLGLCQELLGNNSGSSQHHQEALRAAIRMQTLYGQSIAVGNLGMLAKRHGDPVTAKACLEQVGCWALWESCSPSGFCCTSV